MTIIVDSREKKHVITGIISEFDRQGMIYTVSKLPVGDYMSLDNAKLVVDRKRNLHELLTNLCTGDKSRFWREVRESRRLGIKMVVLCEHGGQYHSIADVANWSGKELARKDGATFHISGRDLMEQIYRCHISYGVEFLFCDKRQTGKRIIELLGGADEQS